MLLPLDLQSQVQFLRLLFDVDKLAFPLPTTSLTCKGYVALHHQIHYWSIAAKM